MEKHNAPKKLPQLKNYDAYQAFERPDDRKMYMNSLTVDKGTSFQNKVPVKKLLL